MIRNTCYIFMMNRIRIQIGIPKIVPRIRIQHAAIMCMFSFSGFSVSNCKIIACKISGILNYVLTGALHGRRGDPRRVRSTYMGCRPLENLYDGPCEARQTAVPGWYSMSPLPPSLLRALKQFKIFVCSFVITRRWCRIVQEDPPLVFLFLSKYCLIIAVYPG